MPAVEFIAVYVMLSIYCFCCCFRLFLICFHLELIYERFCSFTDFVHFSLFSSLRSSSPEVFCEKGVLRNFAKFPGNTCARVPFVFSCEFCGTSKNTFSYRTPPVAASDHCCSLVVHL